MGSTGTSICLFRDLNDRNEFTEMSCNVTHFVIISLGFDIYFSPVYLLKSYQLFWMSVYFLW